MTTSETNRRDATEDFVGREHDLRQLEAHLSAAAAGQGNVILVSGEAGIGKSALMNHFLALTAERHPEVAIARGECSERFGQGEAFLPFIEALGVLLADEEEQSVQQKMLSILLETAPSWLEAVPAIGQALRASYETAEAVRSQFGGHESPVTAPDPERMLREYTGIVTRLSQASPVLIFIDDLQWSDAGSVDLLVHLSRRIGSSPVLVLGTYRPSDVDVGRDGKPHPLHKAMLEMGRYNACGEMTLKRLGPDDTAAILAAQFPNHDFPPALADTVHDLSDGNPLFFIEMLHLLQQDGFIEWEGRTWRLVRPVEDAPLPKSVESVLLMRLDRLQADLHRTLQYASAEGERFLSTVLAHVLRTDELSLEEQLDVVERVHRLIRTEGELEIDQDLATIYEFAHGLFDDILYKRLRPKQRVLLHRRTGTALEELYGKSADEIAHRLALHFSEGRLFEKALHYSLAAARQSEELNAAHEAIRHYESAQRLMEKIEHDPERQLMLDEGLGDMRALLGQHDMALTHYAQARSIAESIAEPAQHRAALFRKTAMLHERKGNYTKAFDWLDRGLQLLGENVDLERARMRLAGAGIHSRRGSHREALSWCTSGLELAKEARGKAELAHGVNLLGTVHWHLGHIPEMIKCSDQSLTLYESLGDLMGQAKTLHNLGIACTESGDWSAALRHFRHAIEIENQLGDVHSVAKTTNSLGVLLLHRGAVSAAAKAYQRCLDIWEGIGFPIGVALIWSNLGEVHIERQEWEFALDYLKRSEEKLHEIESALFLPEVYRRKALVYLHTDRLPEARRLSDRSIDLATKLGMTLEKGISLRVQGQIKLALEQWEQAEAALTESLKILEEQGNQYQMGETLYHLGRLHQARGGRENQAALAKAEAALARAQEIFRELGAEGALARVEEAIE